ncbi:hypothetical protein [Microbulbifer mangrovi]|uniref:hypothetical protein n=1 Tax=Microbulbifer mangrovi TaxID=927787 RepID=UPI000990679B|nr:hypothetical protein [Microbulbifer mangrovi]
MKSVVVGVVVGIAVAYLGVYFTGFSAAIAVPKEVSDLLSPNTLLVWDIAVTQFLGYGVIAFLLVFFSIKLLRLNAWMTALIAIVSCEVVLFATYSSQYMIYVPHFVVLIGCGALAAFMARRQANA